MKATAISGSARKDGNTAILARRILNRLEQNGIETELVQLYDKTILPCRACFACKDRGSCVHTNDDFADIWEKLCSADIILLASPVYSADVSAKMKALLERGGVIASTNPHILAKKIGASVAAVRRGGGMSAIDTMNHFLLNKEIVVAGSTYWNMVYGKDVGDVENDAEGIANMDNLAEMLCWLADKLGEK